MAEKFDLKPSQQLDHYRIMEEVGSGGLGRVFRALDERTGHTVAIKVLHAKFANNPKFLGIFHRELLIMSRFRNSHIVPYLDSFFEPPVCYIVTAFIEGWSGYAFYKKVKKAPPLVALSIVIDLLQGIDHLHLHDTIHSDLSAANYLINKDGRVFVTDFGLSCQMEVEDYKNYLVGTPGYYSPEHVTNTPLVPQTDIYCAGLILYELITGQKAVPASKDRKEVVKHMKSIDFGLIQFNDKKMTSLMRKLLKSALHYNVNRRINSAELMMYGCYEILKRYRIRYARHVISRFLIDQGLSNGPYKGSDQHIYVD